MTMTAPAPDVQIVPITHSVAEVKLSVRSGSVSVGRVCVANGLWYWQHRDGEQSSPIATSRTEAANALGVVPPGVQAPTRAGRAGAPPPLRVRPFPPPTCVNISRHTPVPDAGFALLPNRRHCPAPRAGS